MNTFLKAGTDAEFFVSKDGTITSAIGFIGGSKQQPRVVPLGNVQEDNVLAEFAIDPVSSKTAWLHNIKSVVKELAHIASSSELSLELQSSHFYEKEELLSFPPMAMELGCEPDFNVYTEMDNPRPSAMTRLRTAAAHVHFSYERPTMYTTCAIIKAMDYVLGLWSVIIDDDVHRRELYGKAGACRLKTYGGEYRTLGNFWLASDEYMSFVFDMTKVCVEHANEIVQQCSLVLSQNALVDIINTCDKPQAKLHHAVVMNIVNKITAGEQQDVKLSA